MTTRIEPTMTRQLGSGTRAVRPVATLVREIASPPMPPAEETRRKYPRLAKVLFAFAAVSVVAAIVVSPTILFLTAWFLLAGYICEVGSDVGHIHQYGVFPGGPASLDAYLYSPYHYNNPISIYRKN